jgi:hypothetical protein
VFRTKTDEERAEAMRQTLAAVEVLEGGLNECSGGKGAFFGGDSVGYVDVLLGGLVSWLKANERISGTKLIDADKTPLLAAWMERFSSTWPRRSCRTLTRWSSTPRRCRDGLLGWRKIILLQTSIDFLLLVVGVFTMLSGGNKQ